MTIDSLQRHHAARAGDAPRHNTLVLHDLLPEDGQLLQALAKPAAAPAVKAKGEEEAELL